MKSHDALQQVWIQTQVQDSSNPLCGMFNITFLKVRCVYVCFGGTESVLMSCRCLLSSTCSCACIFIFYVTHPIFIWGSSLNSGYHTLASATYKLLCGFESVRVLVTRLRETYRKREVLMLNGSNEWSFFSEWSRSVFQPTPCERVCERGVHSQV